jgi:hypothetical protein
MAPTSTVLQVQTPAQDVRRARQFDDEFFYFVRGRSALRRFMPTPDLFPLLCELVDEAKKFYVRLPRIQRNNLRYIPFFYFGREWVIRINVSVIPLTNDVYIDLCDGKSKAALVTVAVSFVNDFLKAESNA